MAFREPDAYGLVYFSVSDDAGLLHGEIFSFFTNLESNIDFFIDGYTAGAFDVYSVFLKFKLYDRCEKQIQHQIDDKIVSVSRSCFKRYELIPDAYPDFKYNDIDIWAIVYLFKDHVIDERPSAVDGCLDLKHAIYTWFTYMITLRAMSNISEVSMLLTEMYGCDIIDMTGVVYNKILIGDLRELFHIANEYNKLRNRSVIVVGKVSDIIFAKDFKRFLKYMIDYCDSTDYNSLSCISVDDIITSELIEEALSDYESYDSQSDNASDESGN